MIDRLLIKQFAIIDSIEIDFRPPFTVLTGETGAGKSILIEAISILLGGRSSVEMIRHGADKAYIEGTFHFTVGHPVYESLFDGGWMEEGETSFVLSRELNVNRRNPCRINGYTVSFNAYRQVASVLLDLHGQHEYQLLMQTDKQLDILDAYGGEAVQELRQQLKDAYHKWMDLDDKLSKARESHQAYALRKDFLAYQLQEIDDMRIVPGEEKTLEAEIGKLTHSQRILKGMDLVYSFLFQYADGESSYDLLSKALRQLRELSRYDPELEGVYDRLEPASFLMDEASREINRYNDHMDVSPNRLEEAETRLYRIKALGKKYGDSTEAILEHRENAAIELADMEEFILKEGEWEGEAAEAKEVYSRLSSEIARQRSGIKKRLEEQVDLEFADLAMKSARFRVDLQEGAIGPKGGDRVEFLISTNTGEPFLPMAKIASGGELSRITLAMKRILAASETCETLVFDEIDSGIGGTTIQAVAEKLSSISKRQQVLCVTHSPIIAAIADQHFLLDKEEQEGRTLTYIREIRDEERVDELVRMLGGDAVSADLRRHAQVMLRREGEE